MGAPSMQGAGEGGRFGGSREERAERSGRGPRREGGFSRDRFAPRRRVCNFCVDKMDLIDYKDVGRLRKYLSERGKIEPRRKTGTCARHQRTLTAALKRARQLALLPYTAEHQRFMSR